MNFSPFAGHFAGAIPAIHQFVTGSSGVANAAAAAAAASASSSSAAAAHLEHQRYSQHSGGGQPHHHSGGGGHSVNIPQFNQSQLLGKLRGEDMNKYGHNPVNGGGQQALHHYGSQYGTGQDGPENSASAKHLRVGGSSHSLGLNSMGNGGGGYHQGGVDQGQDLGHLKNGAPSWQAPSSTVADYLSHLPASTLPLSLHHFLKYSETIKKETGSLLPNGGDIGQQQQQQQQQAPLQLQHHDANLNQGQSQQPQLANPENGAKPPTKSKKKKKSSKAPKEKKPRPKPGEIRLTTALDGSTLFCCPECQMAYPERGLLEQHLVGHNLERRFICDICNAALKRKDHLTRHKQSHNPERPFVCTICMKAFKRKEQLTLHFVIHSGEKRHICNECGKGFYRKDHLRKHTRSHIARRVKAELSNSPGSNGAGSSAAPNIQQQPQQQPPPPQSHMIQQQLGR